VLECQVIPLFIGYDGRQSAAYHVFAQSVIKTATRPVALIPLALNLLTGYSETHGDGSNAFIYSRFLVPHMQGFDGWALFCDGDMVCLSDIAELWGMRDESKAVMVVKHNYQTAHPRKYIGSSMETHNVSYPRKNWSSVMLWNCAHPRNKILTPGYVMDSSGTKLHRFAHLADDEIGELPKEWNYLVGEKPVGEQPCGRAKLVHYTLGIPGIKHYSVCEYSEPWFEASYAMNYID
jgi:lipopolysaccharide biosynthesis glycosyltransferase